MTFVSRHTVRFAHVDAAGIVFYPRYFELLNAAIEDFFARVIGVDFRAIHSERKLGVPTVKLEADFSAPSRLGDELDFELEVGAVGRSSLQLAVVVSCDGQVRLRAQVVLVCIDLSGRFGHSLAGRPAAGGGNLENGPGERHQKRCRDRVSSTVSGA